MLWGLLGLAASLWPASVSAQSFGKKAMSPVELASCVTLNTILEDLETRIDTANQDLRRTRPTLRSPADISTYNQKLYANQQLEKLFNGYVDTYNSNCIQSVDRGTFDEVCVYGNDRMQTYLERGYGCAYWRRKFDQMSGE